MQSPQPTSCLTSVPDRDIGQRLQTLAKRLCSAWQARYGEANAYWHTAHFSLARCDGAGWKILCVEPTLASLPSGTSEAEILVDLNRAEVQRLKGPNNPSLNSQALARIDWSALAPDIQPKLLGGLKGLHFTCLTLSGCNVYDKQLKAILSQSKSLEALNLERSWGVKKLTYLSVYCPSLRCLSVRDVPTLHNLSWDGVIQSATAKLEKLEFLDISSCKMLKRVAILAPRLQIFVCQGEHLPAMLELGRAGLEFLVVDDDSTLQSLKRLSPKALIFRQAEIFPLDLGSFEVGELGRVDAIEEDDDDHVGYLIGSIHLPHMIARGASVGFSSFFIHDRQGGQESGCLARQYDPQVDKFSEVWSLMEKGLSPKNISWKFIGGATQEDIQVVGERCARLGSVNIGNGQEKEVQLARAFLRGASDRTDALVCAMYQGEHSPTALSLAGFARDLTDVGIRKLAVNGSNLTELNLYDCNITPKGFASISLFCTALTALDLTPQYSARAQLTDNVVRPMVASRTSLTLLKLNKLTEITDNVLDAVGKNCPDLKTLGLQSCRGITSAGFSRLVEKLRGLTSVDLCHTRLEDSVSLLAQRASGLIELNLSWVGLKEAHLGSLARHATNLRVLNVSNTRITDEILGELARNCHQLTSLDLSNNLDCKVSDIGLASIATGCTGLTSIDLLGLERLTDDGVIHLARACTGLTSIDLTSCKRLTDNGVIHFARACTGLTYIRMAGGGYCVTERAVFGLVEHCQALSKVDLGRFLTDRAVSALMQKSTTLTSLEFVCEKDQLTDMSAFAIARAPLDLRYVNFGPRDFPLQAYEALTRRLGPPIHPGWWQWGRRE